MMVARIEGRSPSGAIVFNLPSAKNPRDRPSGDQNGYDASALPAISRGTLESSRRTHSVGGRPAADATNATCWPSGDKAKCGVPADPNGVNVKPDGGTSVSFAVGSDAVVGPAGANAR